MPDSSKAKERRRRRQLEEAEALKNAATDLMEHNEASKELLVPEGFNFLAGREDRFLQTEITIYHDSVKRDFAISINGRLLGPFRKHELQCLRDCLRNDIDI